MMARVAIFALIGAVASCASAPARPAPVVVPEHTHTHTQDESCTDQCFPGACDAAYSIPAQAHAPCEEEGEMLCICRAP